MKYRARFLTPGEADILVPHCAPECRGVVQAALGTGMRLGELLGLFAGAVVLDGDTPVVSASHCQPGQAGISVSG